MVVVRIWEGLGNQLFQYAYARALQLRSGQKVYIDCERRFALELEGHRIQREYALHNFNIRLGPSLYTDKIFFFLKNKTYLERLFFFFSQRNYAPFHFYQEDSVVYKEKLKYLNGTYYVMGWFQNEKYFKEYRKQLLRELRPKKRIRMSLELTQCMKHNNTVSIHIRRGDFKKQFNTLSIIYYEKAVKKIESMVKNPFYIIFSDDIQWAQENMKFLKDCMFISREENLNDFEENCNWPSKMVWRQSK